MTDILCRWSDRPIMWCSIASRSPSSKRESISVGAGPTYITAHNTHTHTHTHTCSHTCAFLLTCPSTSSPSPFKGSSSQDANITYCPQNETATLVFPATLPLGDVVLYLEYTGKLQDNMKGFYRSSYTHPNWPGEERYLGVTQFEVGIFR